MKVLITGQPLRRIMGPDAQLLQGCTKRGTRTILPHQGVYGYNSKGIKSSSSGPIVGQHSMVCNHLWNFSGYVMPCSSLQSLQISPETTSSHLSYLTAFRARKSPRSMAEGNMATPPPLTVITHDGGCGWSFHTVTRLLAAKSQCHSRWQRLRHLSQEGI